MNRYNCLRLLVAVTGGCGRCVGRPMLCMASATLVRYPPPAWTPGATRCPFLSLSPLFPLPLPLHPLRTCAISSVVLIILARSFRTCRGYDGRQGSTGGQQTGQTGPIPHTQNPQPHPKTRMPRKTQSPSNIDDEHAIRWSENQLRPRASNPHPHQPAPRPQTPVPQDPSPPPPSHPK